MIRGRDESGLNLAIGEPYFLQEILSVDKMSCRVTPEMAAYTSPEGYEPLVEHLKQLYGYKHAIVCNGAKQAIAAAFHGLAVTAMAVHVWHPIPYWPSFPTLARQSGLEFETRSWAGLKEISIQAWPGNPASNDPGTHLDIWDAAYATPAYGYTTGTDPSASVRIGTASKMFGLSGLRVGWLLTNDDGLAQEAAWFMETQTSGVSTVSQEIVHRAFIQHPFESSIHALAHAKLRFHAELFKHYLGRIVDDLRGMPSDGLGMFAWFRLRGKLDQLMFKNALLKTGVSVIPGIAFGETEPGWCRMSLGHRTEVTEKALRLINAAM
jgi:aspartate/methionine/tyrosine aminotransferase